MRGGWGEARERVSEREIERERKRERESEREKARESKHTLENMSWHLIHI